MNRFVLLLFPLFMISCSVQNWATKEVIVEKNYLPITDQAILITENNDTISNAMYPNGYQGIVNCVNDHFRYPKEAREQRIYGRVHVYYIVEKNGFVSGVKVTKGIHPSLDNEAKRIVKKLDRFIPGIDQNGNPVRMSYTIPVNFKL